MTKIEINADRCKSCQLCLAVCPKKIIAVSDKLNVKGGFPCYIKDPDACIACTQCALICPDVAITITEIK